MSDLTYLLLHDADGGRDRGRARHKMIPKKSLRDFLQMRYVLVALCFYGSFCLYASRVALSMAIVCMVNHTAILQNSHNSSQDEDNVTYSNTCARDELIINGTDGNATHKILKEDGPFMWNEELQGIILSSFFWGYVFTQIPGGFLADKLGGKWILGLSVLLSSLLTMLIPVAAYLSPTAVIVCRILSGIIQGVFFPTYFSIYSKWIPKQEKSRAITIAGNGIALSFIATYPIAAALCKSNFLGGWPSIFYVIGSFGVLWFILWCVLMYEFPSQHPFITPDEQRYIDQNTYHNTDRSQIEVPWCKILTSPPVLALCVNEFCRSFKLFLMMTQLPTYLKVILNFTIEQNGLISIVPHVLSAVVSFVGSWIADTLINKGTCGTTCLRKSMTLAGATVSFVTLIAITQMGCDRVWIVILLWAGSLEGLNAGGVDVNVMDLSPNYTGATEGILNTMSAASGIAAPYMVGLLTKNNNTKSQWDIALYVTAGIHLFGTLTYMAFGSGELQPWDSYATKKQHDIAMETADNDSNYHKSSINK